MTRVAMMAVLTVFLAAPLSEAIAAPTPTLSGSALPLAIEWDWDWQSFKKFWNRQLGKTTGVVGTVSLVVGVGILIVMSAKHKT